MEKNPRNQAAPEQGIAAHRRLGIQQGKFDDAQYLLTGFPGLRDDCVSAVGGGCRG